jgi:hypothetical protein
MPNHIHFTPSRPSAVPKATPKVSPALQQLIKDAGAYLYEQQANNPVDYLNTTLQQGYANYLLNKFINLIM